MKKLKILIVDDEPNVCTSLKGVLEDEGYEVSTASNGEEALEQSAKFQPDIMLLDVVMPKIDGIEVLKRIKTIDSNLGVIVMSGHGTIEIAVKALKLGALDFITKPISLDSLLIRIEQALEKKRLKEAYAELKSEQEKKYTIIGKGQIIQGIIANIRQIAPTNARVLITGESGTGKELVARAVHKGSLRSEKPFIQVNCAAIPQDLIESELFGYEKGAFTGAHQRHIGKFERANGGTLFLDEIADMSPQTQSKVLRAIEEGQIERLGSEEPMQVDVRIIAATNKNLIEEFQMKRFREDLYYRLNVVPIYLPPLRERKEDISVLAEHFLRQFCLENNKTPKKISPEAMRILEEYHWPGNVRELRNITERFVIMCPASEILPEALPPLFDQKLEPSFGQNSAEAASSTLKDAKNDFERNFIIQQLKSVDWNITEAAKLLRMDRTNLHRKMKLYNIVKPEDK